MYESLTVASTVGTIDPLDFLCFCRFRAQALAHPTHPVLVPLVHGVMWGRADKSGPSTPQVERPALEASLSGHTSWPLERSLQCSCMDRCHTVWQQRVQFISLKSSIAT